MHFGEMAAFLLFALLASKHQIILDEFLDQQANLTLQKAHQMTK